MYRLALCAAACARAQGSSLAGPSSGQDVFDCTVEASKWETAWSVQRQEWCCAHRRVACAAEEALGPAVNRVLADGSRFDCQEDLGSWESSWDPERKKWCCSNEHVGCPWESAGGGATPAIRDSPSAAASSDKERAKEREREKEKAKERAKAGAAAEGRSEPFDCWAGLSRWKTGWSKAKKGWCCENKKKGCEATTATSTTTRGTDHGPTDFNCRDDLTSWKHKWSFEQKAWCCSHRRIGCEYSFDCRSGFHSCKTGWSDLKIHWCSTIGVECGVDKYDWLFDCHEGFSNMASGWSDWKKKWCCDHKSVGCEMTTTMVSGLHDCTKDLADFQNKWHWRKQKWCCEHVEVGCLTGDSPFSFASAANSNNKSRWGCEGTELDRAMWTADHREWCDQQQSPQEEDWDRYEHFDCPQDASPEEVEGWSIDHKYYCCMTTSTVGCGESSAQPAQNFDGPSLAGGARGLQRGRPWAAGPTALAAAAGVTLCAAALAARACAARRGGSGWRSLGAPAGGGPGAPVAVSE